ncbi:MAG: rhomboid family intramembrane serine protease [Steroidobacteraceae bacterium]
MSGIGPGSGVLLALILALSLIGLFGSQAFVERCLFRPYWYLRNREYSTALLAGFVHADLPHLLFNSITFWFFGLPLERRIGTRLFLVLYFTGLAASQFGTWWKHRDNPDYATLGASGAISAVLFASIVYNPAASIFILPIPVPIPAPLFAVGYLAYTWWSAKQARGRINHDAHFAGALAGLAFVALAHPQAYDRILSMLSP